MYESEDKQPKRVFYYNKNNNNIENDDFYVTLCLNGMLFKKAI